MSRISKTSLFVIVAVILAACRSGEETGAALPSTPKASQIVCHAAYRTNTGTPIEREEMVTLDDVDAVHSIAFNELEFHIQYSTGESNRERTLRLWTTEPGQSASLTSQLYQLPLDSGPTNQFIGGHGFTGLNYVYHSSGAELQFWCEAQ